MIRSLTIPLIATCFVLGSGGHGSADAFLSPSQPSRNVAFPVGNQGLYKTFALRSSNDRGSIFSFPRRSKGDAKKVVSKGSRSRKIRRSVGVLLSAALFWFGAAGLRTTPSHASTTVAPISSSTRTATLDKMVDGYVKDHMFDDDAYEPVESVYREAIADKVKGSYPKTLSEIASSVLGREGVKTDEQKSASGIGGLLLNSIKFLQRKAGLTETAAIIVLTGSFVVAGPLAFVVAGMMVGAQSKRQMNSVMKTRYGDTYT